MGSCDNHIDDSMPVVALNQEMYQGYMCLNSWVEVVDLDTGAVSRFQVADRCAGCGWGGIDFTPAAWRQLGRDPYSSGEGRIKWRFV